MPQITSPEQIRPSLIEFQRSVRLPGNTERLEAQMKARLLQASDNLACVEGPEFEVPAAYANEPVFQRMADQGLLSAKQLANLHDLAHLTLAELIQRGITGAQLLTTPHVNGRSVQEVYIFIAANYGLEMPSFKTMEVESLEDLGPIPAEAETFEADLETFINDPIDFDVVGSSPKAREGFGAAGIITVGDWLVISGAKLSKNSGVPPAQVQKLSDYILEKYKFSMQYMRESAIATAVRLKVAEIRRRAES